MKKFRTTFVLLTALLAFSGAVSAATTGGPCSSPPSSALEISASIDCPLFNPAFGALTSIQLTINGQIEGTIEFTNNSNESRTVSADGSSEFVSLSPLLLDFSTPGFPSPLVLPSFVIAPFLVSPGTTATPFNSGPASTTSSNFNAATFASYTGVGVFSFIVNSQNSQINLHLPLTGDVSGLATIANGVASADVLYTYTPFGQEVPEPSTVVFFSGGLALMAIGAHWRRRTRV